MILGEIALQLYNPHTDLQEVLKVLEEAFMKDANTFIAFEMNKSEAHQGRLEFENFILALLRAGLSLVARHLPSNRIAGFSVNIIQSRPESGQLTLFEEFKDRINCQQLKDMINFRLATDKFINLFENFNTECFFECVYLATLPDFRGRRVAHHLVQCSVELAKEIAAGKYPETMIDDFHGKIPKIVYGSWSSKYSAKIAENLGFVVVKATAFSDVKVNGIPCSKKLPPEHSHNISSVLRI